MSKEFGNGMDYTLSLCLSWIREELEEAQKSLAVAREGEGVWIDSVTRGYWQGQEDALVELIRKVYDKQEERASA